MFTQMIVQPAVLATLIMPNMVIAQVATHAIHAIHAQAHVTLVQTLVAIHIAALANAPIQIDAQILALAHASIAKHLGILAQDKSLDLLELRFT